MDLRKALLKAVRQARVDGLVTFRQAARIRAASFSPAFMEQASTVALIEAASDEHIAPTLPYGDGGQVLAANIDWAALGDFLINAVLPLLLAILDALA